MKKNIHIQNLDELSGNEYTCGSIEGYVKDAESFFENAEEVTTIRQYCQTEFKDMPNTLCTLYGNMMALASRAGVDFTPAERRELCTLRLADKDFNPAYGGMTGIGADTVRRWWNTHNPDNLTTTFAIGIYTELGKKMVAKNFPVSTSMRGNIAYYRDAYDGKLDATSWGKTTSGHCRMRNGMKFYDTSKKPIHYEYPTLDKYLEAVDNGYEGVTMFAFFLDNELSTNGKKLIDYMRKGVWNGSSENVPITRYESAVIAKRLGGTNVWNGLDPDKSASKYEVSVMLNRAIGIPIYTGTDRNREITRKETILMLP